MTPEIFKKKTLLFLLFSFSTLGYGQELTANTPDEVFKAFATGFLERDLEKVKKLSIYTEDIELIKELPEFSAQELVEVKKKLSRLPIKWYQPGEIVKSYLSSVTVNKVMANDRRKIGTIRLHEMVYPLILKKLVTGEWKVDPFLMVQSIKKTLKTERKKSRRSFRIDFNGQLIDLNENEKVTFTDDSGRDNTITLFKNEIQSYKDGRISFQYHKDMEVYPGKGKNCFIYTLASDLSPEIHILVYDEGVDMATERQRFINNWIENYQLMDAVFEKERLRASTQYINGKEYTGKLMYAKSDDSVFYNQFYFLEINGRVIGIFAKAKNMDTRLINQYLSIVCENFYPGKPNKK